MLAYRNHIHVFLFRLFLSILFSFGSTQLYSQSLTFTQVAPPREYPFTFIYGISQDPRGYMWIIASQQLYRYDGYKFTVYMNDPSNPNSMAGIRPECVYADKKGFIWVGHERAGLDRLDPQTGIFTHYRFSKNDPTSISTDSIRSILEDHEGKIWIGTAKGLNRFDPMTGKFTRYEHDPNDPSSLSHDQVRVLYEDKSGTIWAGTGTTWYGEGPIGELGGLNKFNRVTGKFIRYLHDPKDSNSLIDNRVNAICEDSRGVFWIGTAGDGLHTMDRETGKFHRHLSDPAHPDRLSRPPTRHFPWSVDYITFIKEDITGAVWIGTLAAGMNRYDPKTQKITHYESLIDNGAVLEKATGYFQAYASSKDSELWVSSWGGNLFKLDPLRIAPTHHNAFPHTFLCFIRDAHEDLWAGTSEGLWFHEPGIDKNAKLYDHNNKNKNSISGNKIHCLFQDKENKLWVGTDSGLNFFDHDRQSFVAYRSIPGKEHSISDDKVYSILEDHNGNFWIGTANGLNIMDRKTGHFKSHRNIPGDSNSLSGNHINCILEDSHNLIWLGTWYGAGVNMYDPESGKFKRYLNGSYTSCLFEDSKGIIWVGTNTSIFRYDRQNDIFRQYSNENLLIDKIYINYVSEDKEKNLWVSSFTGFTKINSSRTESVSYSGNRGMDITDLPDYKGYKDKNGRFYIGDNFGYYSFLPKELVTNTNPPILRITTFRLENKDPRWEAKEDSINRHLQDSIEIALNYDQNNFSFDFVAFHYSHPEENKLYYMLENYDNNWHAATNERIADFFNISPGKYIFRVKARSSNGVWAQKSINLTISAPWWSNWTVRIFGILLAIVLFYRLIRWWLNRNFRFQLERSEEERQLAALRHKTSELEMQVLRTQMNPHFIFNSLNSINRFILQNNKGQASQYLTKFSKLVRLILQNSQAELISLESELESLELYLDLESLRFNYHFNYKISVQPDLDISGIKVPPLIIQPYVENAIWHGLMHKEEIGQLDVEIRIDNDSLYCRIADNGIGRKKSAEMNSKSATRHKSMGLHITSERIALIQKEEALEPAVQILDLANPDGSAAGTEVTIRLPLMFI